MRERSWEREVHVGDTLGQPEVTPDELYLEQNTIFNTRTVGTTIDHKCVPSIIHTIYTTLHNTI